MISIRKCTAPSTPYHRSLLNQAGPPIFTARFAFDVLETVPVLELTTLPAVPGKVAVAVA